MAAGDERDRRASELIDDIVAATLEHLQHAQADRDAIDRRRADIEQLYELGYNLTQAAREAKRRAIQAGLTEDQVDGIGLGAESFRTVVRGKRKR